MDNKIVHYSVSQTIPDAEFLPLLRDEAPYYGNLNRPAQSAFNLANTVAELQSWGGLISILNPSDQSHIFQLYEIGRIQDGETLVAATTSDPTYSRYGIVVAEAEFNPISGLYSNIVVCTFCPNFVYPITPSWTSDANGESLYLNVPNTDSTYLTSTPGISSGNISRAPLAVKTGTNTIFFSGTARLFGINTGV